MEMQLSEYPFWIAGKWKRSDRPLTVTQPYDDAPIGETFLADADDVEAAVAAATSAFEQTRHAPAWRRAEWLAQISTEIKRRSEALARMIAREAGKPIGDARGEVGRAANTFHVASEEAKRIGGETIPLDLMPGSERRIGLTRRLPIGPIVGISPFNFPLNLVAHKIAPALAAGNTLILKPAPKTPLTALLLAEIIASVGVPDGAVNIFCCENALAEAMIRDPRVAMLTFTGSGPVGWHLKRLADKKKVLLELGGNAGVIVHTGADLAYAAQRCAVGGFAYAGQVCISVQRIFVQQEIYTAFLDRFVPQVAALKVGDPLDETTAVGPMIDDNAAARAGTWVQEAVSQGARRLTGGEPLGDAPGRLFPPTVLVDTTPAMRVNCQEVFAPIVTVTPYADLAEAIGAINQSPYGLQAGLFGGNLQEVFRAFEQIEVGGLIVNDVPTYRIDHMPYGGIKESGVGREGIRYAIEEMTELRFMAINTK